jgi:UDP-2-acetamido-3-amino-2,3-dideoxy-glucuronate N-acetyltransferase
MIKVAVVGCGYWGKNLVRNFFELNVLNAISDPDQKQAQALSEQFNDVPILSLKEVAESSSIDAVVIATPAALHAEHVELFLRAGKHVFVEKPLSLDLVSAQHLREVAKACDRVLMVGHLLQYHPCYLKLKEMVAQGSLGKIQYLYSNRLSLGKIRTEENVWWSFAPHDISMILGLVSHPVQEVQSFGSAALNPSLPDFTLTTLTFSDQLKAHIFVSWLHPVKEQKLIVVGEKGMAVFDDCQPWGDKLTLYAHQITFQNGMPVIDKAQGQQIQVEFQEPLRNECQHFIDCVKQNSTPITNPDEAIKVLDVLNLAQKSLDKAPKTSVTAEPTDYFKHESSYVDSGALIGKGTKIWHFSHILGKVKIGQNVVIGQNVMVGPDVVVGNNCKIQNNVSLYKGVVLEDGVFCGPSCVFTNVNNPRAEIERKDEFRLTYVEKGVTIGANATIVCGVRLGAYSFIGAGATVTKDVLPHALMVGVPARQIGWVSHAGERLSDNLICPREGLKYQVIHGKLELMLRDEDKECYNNQP